MKNSDPEPEKKRQDGQRAASESSARPGHSTAAGCRAELRILLVEDSRLLQDRLTAMLTEPGVMRVMAAVETEEAAEQAIDAAEYDVLLVDVELRAGNGIGVIAHARRAYPPDRQPLIIVLTNYPLPVVRARCLAAGADHFLDKMREFQKVKPLIRTTAPLLRH